MMRMSLALCLLVLTACDQGGAVDSRDPATNSVSRFDGEWRGVFDSTTPVGSNGIACVDGAASGTVSNGRMRGKGVTEYGTYTSAGTISPDGSIVGSFELGRFTGEFTGKAEGNDVLSGDFRDTENCRGTWRMEKV